MADFHHQNNPNYDPHRSTAANPFGTIPSDKPSSTSQILPLLTLLPFAAFLLFLAGISFIGSVVALAVSSPLFVICSPVLIPAAVVIAFAVAGFLTSGAFGVTALSSLSWMANNLRTSRVPLRLQQAKDWARDTAAQSAQTVQDMGQSIQATARDLGKSEEVSPAQEGERTEQVGPVKEDARAVEVETAQEKGTSKDEAAQEPVKGQEGAKAQEGEKAQKGKARGGKK